MRPIVIVLALAIAFATLFIDPSSTIFPVFFDQNSFLLVGGVSVVALEPLIVSVAQRQRR